MSYRSLSNNLHSTADAAIKLFNDEFGLTRPKIETALNGDIEYVPTLLMTEDHYWICVDVSEKIMTPIRLYFITECVSHGLPVKLYVVLPKETNYTDYVKEFKKAKKEGIGVIEINTKTGTGEILSQPLSLSLKGVRPIDKKQFPQKYKSTIKDSEESFRNGEPNKACSKIYDELEALTRRIAIKTHKFGLWNQPISDPTTLKTMAWAKVINQLASNLDKTNAKTKNINGTLLSQVHGITEFRNVSGHKPNSRKKLIERDSKLRTRFESAVDLLQALINASKPLRV